MKKRNKKNRSKEKQTQSKKREVRVKSPEDRFLWKLVGVALLAFSAFVTTALASYDWRSVAALNPKPTETTNLVGVIGNAFAYGVFLSFGFAGWCIPVASFLGSLKLLQPIPKEIEEIPNGRVCVRIGGLVLMVLAVTGLFQFTGHWQWVRELVAYTHIGNHAGGMVGYWFMTCALERGVAAFGATFLTLGVLAVAVCMAAGIKTVRSWHGDFR